MRIQRRKQLAGVREILRGAVNDAGSEIAGLVVGVIGLEESLLITDYGRVIQTAKKIVSACEIISYIILRTISYCLIAGGQPSQAIDDQIALAEIKTG